MLSPKVKLRANVVFPAAVIDGVGIDAVAANGIYQFNLDYSQFSQGTVVSSTDQLLCWDSFSKSYQLFTVATLFNATTGVSRIVTAAGTVAIAANDSVVAINKAVGSPTPVQLPLASNKIGAVTISDFKRDAAANNITISPTSPDLIQGLATLTLAANGASVQLFPLPGIGYSL
jgi:hypothetical protein